MRHIYESPGSTESSSLVNEGVAISSFHPPRFRLQGQRQEREISLVSTSPESQPRMYPTYPPEMVMRMSGNREKPYPEGWLGRR